MNYTTLIGIIALWFCTSSARAQLPAVEQIKQNIGSAPPDSVQARLYLHRSETYMQHQLDSALYYIRKSIGLASAGQPPDRKFLSFAYMKLGYAYFQRSDLVQSLTALEQAEQLRRPSPPDSTSLDIQTYIGLIYRSQGNYSGALQRYLAALHTYEHSPIAGSRQMGSLYAELGIIYDYLHRYDLALLYHRKNLVLSKKRGDKRGLMRAYLNMGAFCSNMARLNEARQYYVQALAIGEKAHLTSYVATAIESLGEVAYGQHQYKSAIAYLNQGLRLHRQVGANEYIGITLLLLAKSHDALGNYTAATAYTNQAGSVFRAIRSAHYLQQTLAVKSELLAKSGQYRDALQAALQAQTLKDSLTGIDKQKAVAQVQAAFDLERKQQQITALHKDLALQTQARKTAQIQLVLVQQQRLFSLLAVLFLAVLVWIGYLAFRRQQKARRLLSRQKAEITDQARQLTELNATKDKLFSLVSHDLRSPVARLKQDFYYLQAGTPPPPALRQPLQRLERQVDHILDLLTNLLDWSHSQLTGFHSSPRPICLADSLADLISQSADHLSRKNIGVLNQIPDQLCVWADKHQLDSVLRNLLGNAIKFTPPDGFIRLQAVSTADRVELTIQDTGIGMSPDALARLLTDPLVRPGTGGEPGTGLGLRLCHELLVRQAGTMRVESRLGKGTAVHISLPASEALVDRSVVDG